MSSRNNKSNKNDNEEKPEQFALSVVQEVQPTATLASTPAFDEQPTMTSSPPKHCNNSNDNHKDKDEDGNQQQIDFIGTSHAVKDLFSIPYSIDKPLNVAVHNLDGTLLLDVVDVEHEQLLFPQHGEQSTNGTTSTTTSSSWKLLLQDSNNNDDNSENNTTKSQALTVLSDMIQQQQQQQQLEQNRSQNDNHQHEKQQSPPISDSSKQTLPTSVKHPNEYIRWNFQKDLNLLIGSDAIIYRSNTADPQQSTNNSSNNNHNSFTIRIENRQQLQQLLQQHSQNDAFIPDSQHSFLQQIGKPSYAQKVSAMSQQQQQKLISTNNTDAAVLSATATSTITGHDVANTNNKPVPIEASNKNQQTSTFAAPNLEQLRLQTCIIPSSFGPLGSGWIHGFGSSPPISPSSSPADYGTNPTTNPVTPSSTSSPSTPICTVLDAYLDNIMANVPQLALCLQERGFIQSVKILQTDEIPSKFMHPSTLNTDPSASPSTANTHSSQDIFSPQIMELNASALLRFLKANCTRDNATYLLRREPSSLDNNNIQLYDISSISTQRQRKWSWWLAMMSYRFAARLRHLEVAQTSSSILLQRQIRDRQRSLCQTTLDLLQDLADMDGRAHESLVASVREHMADTYLTATTLSDSNETTAGNGIDTTTSTATSPQTETPQLPVPPTLFNVSSMSSTQPYQNIPVDALNKAHEHLVRGIKSLWPVLQKKLKQIEQNEQQAKRRNRRRPRQQETTPTDYNHDENETKQTADNDQPHEAMVLQLYTLHDKIINVSLRLTEHHLKNYNSSSAMQALRTAARRIVDSGSLLLLEDNNRQSQLQTLQFQYIWLWEHCGQFARSFASDELWRDRGHACGDDVISVLRDVDNAIAQQLKTNDNNTQVMISKIWIQFVKDCLSNDKHDMFGLRDDDSLSALVLKSSNNEEDNETYSAATIENSLNSAKKVLEEQRQIQRDKRRALVASCTSYSRSLAALETIIGNRDDNKNQIDIDNDAPTHDPPPILNVIRQRFGDACNETGKVLLVTLKALFTNNANSSDKNNQATTAAAASALLSSARFWFYKGLEMFEQCSDLQNIALLRCNLCQCCKLQANSNFAQQSPTHAEDCLKMAADHLQAAHDALSDRDIDPSTWDMVSDELAATFLVLGVRRRQALLGNGNLTPAMTRLIPGKERSIIEPMEKSLVIYERLTNLSQAAAVHYQLALTFSKLWTCQINEAKTREKLSSAFEHYNLAHVYYSRHNKDPTFVLLCLDLANLYAAVSGETCLCKALSKCLDTVYAFETTTMTTVQENSQLVTLAASVEDRIFKLLRTLVKLKEHDEKHFFFKDLYRIGLQTKMEQNVAKNSSIQVIHAILIALREKFQHYNNSNNNNTSS